MAGTRGGARPGAGRKRKSEKFEGQVAKAEKRLGDRLPATIDNLEALADGGSQRVEEKLVPAGTVTVPGPLRDREGNPTFDARGKAILVAVPAFPGVPPGDLVVVERRVVTMGPDFRANAYLADRVMGKPTERHELAGEGGEPFKVYVGFDPERV